MAGNVVQAQVVGAPAQVVMGSIADIFNGAGEIMVKQEWAAIEFCGCEAKNRYRISVPQGEGEGPTFLYISETSDCLERVCCHVNRSLTLNVHQGQGVEAPILMRMKKNFHLQGCCCCCRPKFDVYGPSDAEFIGKIDDPFKCCVMDQEVYGKDSNLLFHTSGSSCQQGMWPCCVMCQGVFFSVQKNGNQVAKIEKMPMSCEECFTKTNKFKVYFNELVDPQDRKMLLASAMLLDLQYFEQEKK